MPKIEDNKDKQDNHKVWIASFDPGSVNFSFCIQELDLNDLKKVKPLKLKRNATSDEENQYDKNLQALHACSKVVIVKNTNLTLGCNKDKYVDLKVFYNITDYLDEYKSYFDKCSYIVVEQQMSFGKKKNTLAVKIAQHIISYFIFNYGSFKRIYEYPSYNKTQVLNAPKKMDKPARKKWAISKALDILENRRDLETHSHISKSKKKDDLSDTIVMTESFVYSEIVLAKKK